MWKSALKQIWKNKKSNTWIFIELFVVFILLWYCFDFLYVVVRKNIEPMGINTEHVYRLKLGAYLTQPFDRNNPDSVEAMWINPFLQIVKVVNSYPGVEATTYYYGSEPYDENVMMQGYTADEENAYGANIRYISENYDKVFQVKMDKGGFSEWGIQNMPQGAVISTELADSLFQSQSAIGKTFHDYYEPTLKFRVTGICKSMKYDKYGRYQPFIYTPFNSSRFSYSVPVIGVRIKPEADSHDFAQRFMEDMKSKLNIGPFYLFSFMSYDFKSEVWNTKTGINKYISSIIGLMAFFIFIVFLGILGTFWVQMESRRSEIGLRMALGATRKKMLGYTISESMLIFLIAFIPALIICTILSHLDIIYTFNDAMDYTKNRFGITIVFTTIAMIGVIILGVLLPAYRASKVHPVEALRDE